MNSEQLIEMVKQYEHLYNVASPHYKDVGMKENSWSEIATEMGCPTEGCKKEWKLLRDNFSRELRKKKRVSGSKGRKLKTWAFFDQMSFIKDHVRTRKGKKNTTNLPNEGVNKGVEEEEIEDEEMDDQSSVGESNNNINQPNNNNFREKPEDRRKRGKHLNELMIKELERPLEDKYDHFGRYIASELRSIGNSFVAQDIMIEFQKVLQRKRECMEPSTSAQNGDPLLNDGDFDSVNFTDMLTS